MKKYLFIEAVSDGFGDLHVRLNPLDGVKYREVSLADIEKESFVARNEDIKIKICISDESGASEGNEIKSKKVTENVMPRIGGKSFRCSCGCNVFHHPEPNDKTVYECNACEAWYRGE